MATIEHVFVLMLENRSFDHFFGLSGLPGVPAPPSSFGFTEGATDTLVKDPPHEYDDVQDQVANGAMTGFVMNANTGNMKGFLPAQIPVLMSLAQSYLLMDNWYSAMPGPTVPNRLFAHAASSGGLDNSPAWNDVLDSEFRPDKYFEIENGHLFDRLTAAGRTWRVYHGDRPLVLGLQGMVSSYVGFSHPLFQPSANLAADLAKGDAAAYTWIEPTYDPIGKYRGDSQHPLGSVAAGEALIKMVYNAVRQSPLWEKSLLLITWDEHGGFFDHVSPKEVDPPGDQPLSHDRSNPTKSDCKFDVLGPRVPAILISPRLPSGLGSSVFPKKFFDHSSIVASVRSHFALGPPLTKRDATATDWTSALTAKGNTNAPGPLKIKTAAISAMSSAPPATAIKGPPPQNLTAFYLIAKSVDFAMAKITETPAISVTEHKNGLAKAHALLSQAVRKPADQTRAHKSMVQYIAAVDAREADLRRQQRLLSSSVIRVPRKKMAVKKAKG